MKKNNELRDSVNLDGVVISEGIMKVEPTDTLSMPETMRIIARKFENISKAIEGPDLAEDYLVFESVGQQFEGVFQGFKTVKFKDKITGEFKDSQTAISLMDASGKKFVNAGVSLVDTFTKAVEDGTMRQFDFVRIEFTGKTKLEKGSVHNYSVKVLYFEEEA